jgi:hypothetical protein
MRELAKKQLFRVWDKKSHTVAAEEADHHQAKMEILEGRKPRWKAKEQYK